MSFGGWSIDKKLYDEMVKILPEGKTILEFGSGAGSVELRKRWKLYSIEDDKNYINNIDNYIHAPLVDDWYDAEIIKREMPDYDLILVDGPYGGEKRTKMIEHLNLFKKDVPWILDDTNNKYVKQLLEAVSKYTQRSIQNFRGIIKSFAIV